MTPEELDAVTFGKASFLRRGYDELQVDEEIQRIQVALRRGDDPRPLADQVRAARFSRAPLGRLGYAMNQVDIVLGRILTDLTGEASRQDWHHTDVGEHLLTDPAAVKKVRREGRDAARRGRAAVLRGDEPDSTDRLATVLWATMQQNSRYGDPFGFVLFAVLPAGVVLVGIIVQLTAGRMSLGWALAGIFSAAWLGITARPVRVKRTINRWLNKQVPRTPDAQLSDLLGDADTPGAGHDRPSSTP